MIEYLELKIPPPVVALLAGTLMWLISRLAGFAAFAVPGQTAVAVCLAATGLVAGLVGIFSFHRARTTHNPLTPAATTTLVVIGIFRYSRNPMYLGLLLVLLAWATFLGNVLAFALVPMVALYLTRFQIAPEERALARKFGPQFAAYRDKVGRWL